MGLFFLCLEVFLYGFAFYVFATKKDLAIIYLPVLLFTHIIINSVIPASIFYAAITLIILRLMARNSHFYRHNIFALLIAVYYFFLLPKSSDVAMIRPFLFAVYWFFLSLPLINTIYQKYDREVIFKELTHAAFLILGLFIVNVLVSSVFKYSPQAMYGITSGLLYGNIYAADFNILPVAIFIIALGLMQKKNTLYFLVLVVAFAFIMLTLRRSVMGQSAVGVIFAVLISMAQKNIRKVLFFGLITFFVGFIIYANTEFMSVFQERYELRNLEDRALEEEARFLEYDLILKDMFIYRDYSPWFGFELFNSWGNYGRGILGDRSLHSDITNIAHSSGILGLILYFLMIATAFLQSFRKASTRRDKIIVLFCGMTFAVFTTTGRYTETGYMLLLFLLLLLPLAKEAQPTEEPELVDEAEPGFIPRVKLQV
jgi:O-antigen ligase